MKIIPGRLFSQRRQGPAAGEHELPANQAPALDGPAILQQRWSHVTFLHWKVEAAAVEPYMPPGCAPDTIDGSSWVGLICFQMSDSRFFDSPRVPWLGNFPEVNVRLYSMDDAGRRGVVFCSLEASHLIPVLIARASFGLQYHWASMKLRTDKDKVTYITRRHRQNGASSRFTVRPSRDTEGERALANDPVSTFLTARWGFHETRRGRSIYCRNHHEPWPLRRAELLDLDDELLELADFGGLTDRMPDSVLYSPGVTTVFGAPQS